MCVSNDVEVTTDGSFPSSVIHLFKLVRLDNFLNSATFDQLEYNDSLEKNLLDW